MLRVDSDAGERGVADGGRTDRHRTISHGQDPLSFSVNTLVSPHKRDEFHRQSEMNKSEDRLSVTEEDEEEDEVDMDNDSDDQSDAEPYSGMSAGARSPRVAHPGHDRTPSAHATATKPPLRSSFSMDEILKKSSSVRHPAAVTTGPAVPGSPGEVCVPGRATICGTREALWSTTCAPGYPWVHPSHLTSPPLSPESK